MGERPGTSTGNGERLLKACTLFRALDDTAARQLASRSHRRRLKAGDVIFHIGSPGESLMAVAAGTVRISVPSTQGKEIVLADLEAGDVFGEIALLDGRERTADAVALTNCELLVLERRDVLAVLKAHPEVSLQLLAALCDRLRRADEQLGEIAFLDLPMRLAKVLRRASRGNASAGSAAPRRTKLALSQRELGSMVGGTRESVNRCLRQWHERGIIRLEKGWIKIVALEALDELAGPG